MMGEEAITDEIHRQIRGKQIAQDMTSTCANKPKLPTQTTRPKKGQGKTINKDNITQEKYEQGDCKNHLPASLEQELEATMTPTATADSQPREEQDAIRKRRRISKTEAIQHIQKTMRKKRDK